MQTTNTPQANEPGHTARSHRHRTARLRWAALLLSIATLAFLVAFSVSAVRTVPAGAQLNEPAVSTPQLLTNPDFGQGTTGWSLAPGANWAVYQGSTIEDTHFLEANTGTAGAGGSFYQDVGVSLPVGHSYRASILLRSPSGGPVSASLALWALNGPSGNLLGITSINVSSTDWQRFTSEVDVTNSGYSDLRLQLYINTVGVNVDAGGALLQDAGLANASFEQGVTNWSLSSGSNWAIYSGSAEEDSNFLEWNSGTTGSGASIYQDVSSQPTSGEDYQGTMMVRSPSGAPVSLELYLWAMGGTSANVSGSTSVTVSSTTWQPISVVLHVPSSGYTDLRLQLSTNTTGDNIDVDAASLTDAGLTNSNFEGGLAGWTLSPSGMNAAVYSGSAYAGSNYLEMNTGTQTSATVSSNTPFSVSPGAYDAYVALRSPSGTPANVHLRLYTTGGTTEVALSQFTVSSSNWAIYSVELDVSANGHTGLDFRVGLLSSGVNVDVDTVDLVIPHADPPSSSSNCTPNNSCSPVTFSDALLAEPEISAPATGPNVYALEVWDEAEGGGAGCPGQPPNTAPWSYSAGPAGNPINTTQSNAGSQPTTWNSVGVQQFQDADGQTCWYWGLSATYQTLINGYYGGIIQVLQNPASTNNAQCVALAQAVGQSPWGTGDFSADCNNTVSAT